MAWLRALAGLALTLLAAQSGAVDPPEVPAGVRILSAPEVLDMRDQQGATLVHTLSRIEYEIQHIPGSINIPVVDLEGAEAMPEALDTPLIFYCMGPRCEYSKRASIQARDLGYRNVYWFRGGIPEWRRFNYPLVINPEFAQIKVRKLSPSDLERQLGEGAPPYLLDVRPLWWQQTRALLPQSHFIPLVELHRRLQELPKDRPLVVIDGAMMQSPSAARFLSAKGFAVSGVLKGGILRWEKEGLAVTFRDTADAGE